MHKQSIDLHVMWHIDAVMHLFPVTIVTSVDQHGMVNAAPYSLVVPFCSSPKNPQMLLIANRHWHTALNIEATGEFVLNYPRAEQIQDIVETSRLYPAGENELGHTRFTTLAAAKVSPPRIAECYQHVECRVRETLRPSSSQLNFIADVLDVSLDESLYDRPRAARIAAANPPVYLGVDEEMHHVFARIADIAPVLIDLKVTR